MNLSIKNIIYLVLIYLTISCNNSFLDDNISPSQQLMGHSNIYVSPNWENAEYQFNLGSLVDNDYEIIETPSWLQIDRNTGSLSKGLATVNCSATNYNTYNEYGIYTDFMTVKTNKNNYKVTVAYINEGEPLLKTPNTLDITYETAGDISWPVQNRGKGILRWKFTSLPEWLEVDTVQVGIEQMFLQYYHGFYIPLKIIPENFSSTISTDTIVLSTNDKTNPEVTIDVIVNLGTPEFSIDTNEILFHSNEYSTGIGFSNKGEGTLVWQLTDIPDWLTITPSSGVYSSHTSYSDIVFTCDATKLSSGQNTASVKIKTNESSESTYSIKVIANAPGDSERMYACEGEITDALFNKETNSLYYTTTSPNKLITLNIDTKEVLNEIDLNDAPTCIAISEDWTKAAIGHNGYISAIDLSNNIVTSVYTIDYSVRDIASGEDDWFCYLQKDGNSTSVHYLNTSNGTTYDDVNTQRLDSTSILKKIPGEPYLIAARNSSRLAGFFCFDIATKSLKGYSYKYLSDFWFSEDGEYVFSGTLDVYRSLNFTESNDNYSVRLSSIDKIYTGSYYYLKHAYHSGNYLWIIQKTSYSDDKPSLIYKVEDSNYNFVKRINYNSYYQPDAQTNEFEISANYVFANNDGTEVVVMCKGIS